jgi:hypothetical protein
MKKSFVKFFVSATLLTLLVAANLPAQAHSYYRQGVGSGVQFSQGRAGHVTDIRVGFSQGYSGHYRQQIPAYGNYPCPPAYQRPYYRNHHRQDVYYGQYAVPTGYYRRNYRYAPRDRFYR